MIEKLKKIYYCEHCSKKAFTKHTIAKHEPICFGNEETRPACANDCIHLQNNTGEHKGYWCTKLEKKIHTPGAEVYGLVERYPEQFEESQVMPKHCIAYEAREYFPAFDPTF
ncbi:hypothetical protein [Rufibacter soli]